ncbi:hypothetical protein GCM10027176_32780 [Actinoallomurus bryophytorum]
MMANAEIAHRPTKRSFLAVGIAVCVMLLSAVPAFAVGRPHAHAGQPPVNLGTAANFGVLAGSTVTNTGPTVVNGDVGLSPGTAVTGFPPGTVSGTIHAADAVAAQAQIDLTAAYNDAASRGPAALVAGDLGGQTLTPGVYQSGSSLGITGTVTLDGQGDPNAVFIIQMGSTLTTASNSRVRLINRAQAANVFWQVGSSATLGTNSIFVGNILALTSITVTTGVKIFGRALARNGAVTLDTNIIRSTAGEPTNIDGFPYLYDQTGTGGGPKVWVIGHHGYTPMTAPKIFCTDAATQVPCPDKNGTKAFPMPLNTQPLPLDTDTPGDVATTEVPQFVPDPSGTRIFYPVVTRTPFPGFPGGSVGAGCVDLQNQLNCAYTPLAALTNTAGQSNVNGLAGFVAVGTNLYGTTTSGRELCMSTATLTPCPGQPFATNTPPNDDRAGLGPTDFIGSKAAIGGRVYTASNGPDPSTTTVTHAPALTCFDPATNAPCAGWGVKVLTTASDAYVATAVFPDYDAGGTVVGVCTVTGKRTTQQPTVNCYDFSGNVVTPPPGLAGMFPAGGTGSVIFPPTNLTVGGDVRSYLPFYTQDNVYPGNTLCYDWTVQAACPGFPPVDGHPSVNGGDTHDYGYAGTAACLYGTGDRRFLFTVDTVTGAAEC